jgi:sugar phosphate permease
VLAYAITHLNGHGGLRGWQWIFIIEGIPSIILGLVCWFYLPDDPESCKRLTQKEKEILYQRLEDTYKKRIPLNDLPNLEKSQKNTVDWKSFIKKCAKITIHPRSILFSMLNFCTIIPPYAFSFFLPTIINEMGFKSLHAQLLTCPPYLVAFFFSIFIAWNSDRMKERKFHLLSLYTIQIFGFLILSKIHISNVYGRYVLTGIVINASVSVLPILIAWLYEMMEGEGQLTKAFTPAMVFSIGNIAGVAGPFMFATSGGVKFGQFSTGCISMSSFCLTLILTLYQRFVLQGRSADIVE